MKKLTIIFILISALFVFSACKKEIELKAPQNLSFNAELKVFTWKKEKRATSYILVVNSHTIITKTNEYTLTECPQGVYAAKVKAVYPDGESIYSNSIRFLVKEQTTNVISYTTDGFIYWRTIKDATYEVIVRKNDQVIESKRNITVNSYQVNEAFVDDIYTFTVNSYLSEFLLTSDNFIYDDRTTDYIRGSGDLELNVNEFVDVKINNLKIENNYHYSNNILTINASLLSLYPTGEIIIVVSGNEGFRIKYFVKNY